MQMYKVVFFLLSAAPEVSEIQLAETPNNSGEADLELKCVHAGKAVTFFKSGLTLCCNTLNANDELFGEPSCSSRRTILLFYLYTYWSHLALHVQPAWSI